MFKFSFITRHLFVFVSLLAMLQGCGGGDDPVPTPDQDASGIYTGSAELNTSPKVMPDDLKGMVYDNHFYIFSVNQHVLYDGTITGITGNDVTGTVDVYVDGELQDNDATMTGSVTTESQMSLTINGSLKGSGTLTLTYDGIYRREATQARILAEFETEWFGDANAKTDEAARFYFEGTYTVAGSNHLSGACGYDYGTYSMPSTTANIYAIKDLEVLEGSGCTYIGTNYTGMATVVDNGATDNNVWVAFVNGVNSVFSVASR